MFEQLWDEIGGERGDPLHICVLAHAMADAQDDVREELVWDRRAADLLTDGRTTQARVALPEVGSRQETLNSWPLTSPPLDIYPVYTKPEVPSEDCHRP